MLTLQNLKLQKQKLHVINFSVTSGTSKYLLM